MSEGFDVGADRVKLLIGLFCTETFDMEPLTKKLEELGTSLDNVEKFNIRKGSFIIHTKSGETLKTPIKKMHHYARDACTYCYDFAAEFADVSVGSIGSADGWSTVIVRSEAGKDVMKGAEEAGLIETKKLSEGQIADIRDLASFKKQANLKYIYDKAEPIRVLNMLVEPEMLEPFLCGD